MLPCRDSILQLANGKRRGARRRSVSCMERVAFVVNQKLVVASLNANARHGALSAITRRHRMRACGGGICRVRRR